MTPNDTLRERITDACCAVMVESWMDQDACAAMRQFARHAMAELVTEAMLDELRTKGPEELVIAHVTALLRLIAHQHPTHMAERQKREQVARAIGMGPAHGRN